MAYVDEHGLIYHFRAEMKGNMKSITPEEIARITNEKKGFDLFYPAGQNKSCLELKKCLESSDTLPRAMVLKKLLKFIQGQQESENCGEKY
jgi:hypothetical protein